MEGLPTMEYLDALPSLVENFRLGVALFSQSAILNVSETTTHTLWSQHEQANHHHP